jgi:hypothetical protein
MIFTAETQRRRDAEVRRHELLLDFVTPSTFQNMLCVFAVS